jgi:hypothetical protein
VAVGDVFSLEWSGAVEEPRRELRLEENATAPVGAKPVERRSPDRQGV